MRHNPGFTLIELSIVLVIIGLIIGGILTGQNLIDSAAQRAQISQIEKYNTAVRTFQNKYGFLPGDIPNPYATQFGFLTRAICQGKGNGDGILAGTQGSCGNTQGNFFAAGELAMVWVDLSTAGLIDGNFNTATATTMPGADITGTAIGNYLPQAKIGQGNYIYVWSGGSYSGGWMFNGIHYWGLSVVGEIAAASSNGKISVDAPGMTVGQAYNIDTKVDDGVPQTGNVQAAYIGSGGVGDPIWTDGIDILNTPASTTGVNGSSTTCMDNGGNAGPKHYSIEQHSGAGMNCALSFRFQ